MLAEFFYCVPLSIIRILPNPDGNLGSTSIRILKASSPVYIDTFTITVILRGLPSLDSKFKLYLSKKREKCLAKLGFESKYGNLNPLASCNTNGLYCAFE